MSNDRTPSKWSVWATLPERQALIAEVHDTPFEAAIRAADLRDVGYDVEIAPYKPHAND